MGTIEDRLKSERKRLGLTQEGLAQRVGVNRTAQVRYEKGETFPDANYLAAAASLGIDVQYVVTGMREGALDPSEAKLVDYFRDASQEIKAAALAVLKATPKNQGLATALLGNEVGQVLTGDVRQDNLTINVGSGSKRRKARS